MKKILPLAFMPVLAFACTPDIPQNAAPSTSNQIQILFDPGATVPVVPSPNDLAKNTSTGKLAVPATPGQSDAQTEFNNLYLNTLDNFPFESTASVGTSGDLNATTVTTSNVIVLDITNAAAPTPVTGYTPTYANDAITIAPPNGAWTRGHEYAVVLYAGPGGLTGASGQPVVGSATWALVSSTTPLVTCPDLKTNCRPAVDVIPSTIADPAARLADQTNKALQLEQLRLSYKPILDFAATQGKTRDQIPIVWTFGITTSPEVLFDPANNVIPFPNDVLRDATATNAAGGKGQIKLPNPKTFAPLTAADCTNPTDSSIALVCGLNTLDGFSTTVPPISENSATEGALEQGTIDATSLNTTDVGLAQLAQDPAATTKTAPIYQPCVNCANSNPADPLQTLQWNLIAPLDEKSTYFAYVTTDVKDSQAKNVVANPVFALVRSSASLLTSDNKSAVSIISDAQAALLEPLRLGMKPAFDALAAQGLTRDKIALAFAFTTQSEGSQLDQIRQVIAAQTATALPDVPLPPPASAAPADVALTDITASTPLAGNAGGAKVFETYMVTPVAITGPSGTLNPSAPQPKLVAVDIIVPGGTAPTTGWRVTIFGHGFTRFREDVYALVAGGQFNNQVLVAMDWLDHGNDRSSCTGSKAATGFASDDKSCDNSPIGPASTDTMKCDEDPLQGLCVLKDSTNRAACVRGVQGDLGCLAQGQGFCAADSMCQGAGARLLQDRDAGGSGDRPEISGWNLLNLANFFSARDNIRQSVIDFTQLVRVLKSTSAGNIGTRLQASVASATPVIDTTKIGYVGQSLGGILGTLVNAVSPDTDNVVLNVPGGALTKLLLNATDTLVAKLKNAFEAGVEAQGIQPGTPQFDQLVGFAQWVLDPADPMNLGYRLTHSVNGAPPANRKAFIQFIQGDETVPNVAAFALVAGANRTFNPNAPPSLGCVAPLFCYEFTEAGDNFNTTTASPANRHGFLLSPPAGTAGPTLTAKAQLQASTFLTTGALP